MEQDPDLRTRIDQLSERLQVVESRLAAVEARGNPELFNGPLPPSLELAAQAFEVEPAIQAKLVPLLGRALLVLGGAYLLRAGADSRALPGDAAALTGLVYAGFWLTRSATEAARGGRAGATFHGVSALAIAYPLVVENTLRFHAFDAWGAALALFVIHAAALQLALRHRLAFVGWIGALGAVGASFVLLVATHELFPLTLGLIATAALVERQTGPDRAAGLRWPVGIAATLAVAITTSIASSPGDLPEDYPRLPPREVAAAALMLAALYVVSSTTRTLLRRQPLGSFELVQTPLALCVGLIGAARVLSGAGMAVWPLGVFSLALGAGCYVAAFAVIDRRAGQARAFYSYTTLGGCLALGGWLSVAGGSLLAAGFGALGLAAAFAGARSGRQTLQAHGAVFLGAGLAFCGPLGVASDGLLAGASAGWRSLELAGALAIAAAALGYGMLVARGPDRTAFVPRLLLVAGLGWAVAGLCANALSRWLAGATTASADAALTAAVRMGVLTVLAVALSWANRRYRLRELGVVVLAILIAAALKLVAEDFRLGRPITLFLALAFYGGALLAVPRLRERAR